MKHSLYILFTILLYLGGCNKPVRINDIQVPPPVSEQDKQFADVYKILDGTWKGNFSIFENSKLISKDSVDLQNLTLNHFKSPSLKRINQIEVTQTYESESPYFQRVSIVDYYPETGTKEVSTGVNKIQQGKMWCVVHKLNDMIIHEGSTDGDNTIIWQSHQQSPQKIEYFQETVTPESYEILGYGYYEGDNVELTPRLWFYGKYERQ